LITKIDSQHRRTDRTLEKRSNSGALWGFQGRFSVESSVKIVVQQGFHIYNIVECNGGTKLSELYIT
jgi:hypothetical protein